MVKITDNTVAGDGTNVGIAQNGIEIGDGAAADIEGNGVSDNQYTGTDTNATGILIYDGPGYEGLGAFEGPNYTSATVKGNTLTNNDQGIWLSNLNNPASEAPDSTNNLVSGNTVTNDGTSLNIYAAGIILQTGNGDMIKGNTVYGAGY